MNCTMRRLNEGVQLVPTGCSSCYGGDRMSNGRVAYDMTSSAQDRYPLRPVELLAIFAFWTFMAVLSAANQLLDPRLGMLRSALPAAPLAFALVQAYTWALLTPLIFWLSGRFTIVREQWVQRLLLSMLLAIILAAAVDTLLAVLRHEMFDLRPRGRRPPPGALAGLRRLWFLDDLTIVIAILAVGYARVYFYSFQNRQAEAIRLTAQLADARLSALRTQLNPHFLFNTLNAVSALVEKDPRGVRRMIARLSELLRQTLDQSGEHETPLRDELKFVEHYLDIMQIRFPDTLSVQTSVDTAVLDAIVPKLVLQPLVENAIKHGGIEERGSSQIEITAERQNDELVLSVRDDGPGPDGSATRGAGTGLRNTRERLVALYGDRQSVTLTAAPGGGTLAEVRIPYVARPHS